MRHHMNKKNPNMEYAKIHFEPLPGNNTVFTISSISVQRVYLNYTPK